MGKAFNRKRILLVISSIIISVLCAVCLVACGGNGDGGRGEDVQSLTYYPIYDGDNIIAYSVDGKGTVTDTDIIIPSSYNDKPVTRIGYSAFRFCDSLTSIEIPNSVTSISDIAFDYCSSLTHIKIPDSVTIIGERAFYGCSSLTSIEIPDSVTNIGIDAFKNTAYYDDSSKWENGVLYIGKHLIKVEAALSGSYTIKQGTRSIAGGAFDKCKSLTNIDIPSSVAGIGDCAFYECGVKSIDIPNNLTSIGSGVFYGCRSLLSVKLSNQITELLAYYYDGKVHYGFFELCDSLTSIEIPNSVTCIGDSAFRSCDITSIEIPNSVMSIGDGAFDHCDFTSIEIPDSVTSVGDGAFGNCYILSNLTIGNGVISIGANGFKDCSSLTSIEIGDSVTNIGIDAFKNTAYYDDSSKWENEVLYIGKYIIEAKNTLSGAYTIKQGTLALADFAFSSCNKLSSIIIPNSLIGIGEYAFSDCIGLTSIDVPNSVTYIGSGAFLRCSGLISIDISNSVTSIGYRVFDSCSSLTIVRVPNSVTRIRIDAFYGCSGLTIQYGGTMEQWEVVTKSSGWEYTSSITTIECTDGTITLSNN